MNETVPKRALLIVVSAPSGAGKTTLCDRLLAEFGNMAYSVSCTTRAPRADEVDGTDYFFLDEHEFERRIELNQFLEHAVVHGFYYGTLKSAVSEALEQGRDIIMDIDVQGAAQIRRQVGALPPASPLRRAFVDVFIAPPSIAELRRRLEARAQDAAEVIESRLANAQDEMNRSHEYQYGVVNDDLERAYELLRAILLAEHCRLRGPL